MAVVEANQVVEEAGEHRRNVSHRCSSDDTKTLSPILKRKMRLCDFHPKKTSFAKRMVVVTAIQNYINFCVDGS